MIVYGFFDLYCIGVVVEWFLIRDCIWFDDFVIFVDNVVLVVMEFFG